MPSQRVTADVAESLFSGAATVGDPGTAGTISFNLKGYAHLPLTVGASNETRVLETLTANNYPVGQLLSVYLQTTTGGTVAISGASDGTVTLTTAGDFVDFQVVPTSVSTKAWRVLSTSAGSSLIGLDVVTKTSLTDSPLITGAQLLTRWIEATPTAATDYTLPTAAALALALPGGVAVTGNSFTFTINNIAVNTANATSTLNVQTPGASVTLRGDMRVVPGASRAFRATFTSSSAYTVTSLDMARSVGNAATQAAGVATLTFSQILSGVLTVTGSGASTLTMPVAATLVSAFGNAVVGDWFDLVINNNSDNTVTLAAGGATLEGSAATIATTAARLVRFQITAVGTPAYTAILVI